jgi:hypothetical protein
VTSEHLTNICHAAALLLLQRTTHQPSCPITRLLGAGIKGPRACAPPPRISTCFSCNIRNVSETNNLIMPLSEMQGKKSVVLPHAPVKAGRYLDSALHHLRRPPSIRSAHLNSPKQPLLYDSNQGTMLDMQSRFRWLSAPSHRTNAVSFHRYINYTKTVFTCLSFANSTRPPGASSWSTNDSPAHMKLVCVPVASSYPRTESFLHHLHHRGNRVK